MDRPFNGHQSILLTGLLLICCGCASTGKTLADKSLSGGETTVFDNTFQAFQRPASNLTEAELKDFSIGQRLFIVDWIKAPSSRNKFGGLGPTFNGHSCMDCHFRNGKGSPPDYEGEPVESMLIRLSVPGTGPHGSVRKHPNYGDQLEDRAIEGVPIEGRATIHYHEIKGHYTDGELYSLRVPQYRFVGLNFGPLGDDILFSPRIASFIVGLGLLESVPEETVLSFVHMQEGSPDGVSGKANYVWDIEEQKTVLGRFGWKANQPTIRQHVATAYIKDIGITNPVFPQEDIPDIQTIAKAVSHDKTLEINEDQFKDVVFYAHVLGVPARRNPDDPQVMAGEAIFKRIGCAVCHIETMRTGQNKAIKELAFQTIHPYTDLLLHDMGDGLADGRPDFIADGHEWRTPPLWGIGLIKTVNQHTFFLHDGRARNLEEAILWHDGEARASQQRFKALSKQERQEMLAFLNSL